MIDQIILYGYLATIFGTFYKIFEKAGEDSWKGFVPGLNFYVWLKILGRPWWYLFLLIVPGVNFLVFIILNVQTAWAFRKLSTTDTLLAIFLPFYMLPTLAYKEEEEWQGPHKWRDPKVKSRRKDWIDAVLFAVIAATIIRTFTLEAFTIPTGSMEKSLLKGDFLFVSKVSYGPRMPMTPISFPFVHHTLPFTQSTPSFLEWWTLPYLRLPGFGDIERDDVVVFNFPEGDTVCANIQNQSYYQLIRDHGRAAIWNNQPINVNGVMMQPGEILVRPIDKQENYIKRCVAIPGDSLEIINGQLYVNGEQGQNPEHMQFRYDVYLPQPVVDPDMRSDWLKEEFDIYYEEQFIANQGATHMVLTLTEADAEKMLRSTKVDSVSRWNDEDIGQASRSLDIFPNSPAFTWTKDNYGPIWIPQEGATVALNAENYFLYKRIIEVYEGNTLEVQPNGDNFKFIINGVESPTYTFKQNYYWLMGDNRHNSQDSRFWGFVPDDHVVGKGSFIFFSKDPEAGMFSGGIRWSRMFNLVD